MNISSNHCYDLWASFPDNQKNTVVKKYYELQGLIRHRYVEDSSNKPNNEKRKSLEWRQTKYQSLLGDYDRYSFLAFLTPTPDLKTLSQWSWFLSLKFKLITPLICKDDETFYLHDNPFHKDKVFKVPFYPASSWKGRLRWVAYKQWVEKGGTPEERLALGLLFGGETGEGEGQKLAQYLDDRCPETKEKYRVLLQNYYNRDLETAAVTEELNNLPHHAGRLYFYPTFFDKLGVEVINPHSRKTKAGTIPIQIETVPASAKGIFRLLFTPIHLGAQVYSEDDLSRDLRLTVEALYDMFRFYGFGAKTSSGFGSVDELEECSLTMKNKSWTVKGFEEFRSLPEKLNQNPAGDKRGAKADV